MKKILLSAVLAPFAIGVSHAATVSVSTTVPTVNNADIANLGTATGASNLWSDRPMQGQSFTTGASLSGYSLNSVSFKVIDPDASPGPANLIEGWKDWRMRVSTFSGTTENPFFDETVRYTPDFTDDNYVTFTFSVPINLAASTLYGISLSIPASQEGWGNGIPSWETTANAYAGGQRYQSSANANTYANMATATVAFQTNDTIFHLDMVEAVPEPSTLGLIGLSGLVLLLRRRA